MDDFTRALEITQPVDLTVLANYESIQLEGEPDLIVELIDLYADDAPQRLGVMRQSVAERNWRGVKKGAHSLRGSSGSLGAQLVAQRCQEIELLTEDTWGSIPALMSCLEVELERALYVLLAVRTGRSE
ncbi:MAG: Hpt domain-containing protein [Pyrinomonadaceae bacterium]|nr:Hpt domain-containing protein [Pyrinomonadaceae bacterium]